MSRWHHGRHERSRTAARVAVSLLGAWLSMGLDAHAQSCTWGGVPSLSPPATTVLRAETDLFHAPGRLAVDIPGNLYATDPETGRVIVTDPYGRPVFVKEGLHNPSGIAVDPLGNIYVAEIDTGSVTVFDPNWNAYLKLGGGDGEFSLPNDIAIDPDPLFDRVYVSDGGRHTVEVYSSDGVFLFTIGAKGSAAGQFNFPAAVHVSTAGELFVADQNNDRIQVFHRDGSFARCFGKTGGMSFKKKFGRAQGLTSDSLGRLYVADAFQGHVRVFDPQGVILATIGSFGTGLGEFQTPMGLAIDPFNRLWVASVNNSRLEVFGIDDYSDPRALPAHVNVRPDRWRRSRRSRFLAAYIELPDVAREEVNLDSLTANGVPVLRRRSRSQARKARKRRGQRSERKKTKPLVRFTDYDHDGLPDFRAVFDGREVLSRVEPTDGGAYLVVVEGMLIDGTPFQGTDTVQAVSSKLKFKSKKRRKR